MAPTKELAKPKPFDNTIAVEMVHGYVESVRGSAKAM